MKKIVTYCLLMLMILIILPLLIVRSCSFPQGEGSPEKLKEQVTIKVYFSKEKVTKIVPLEEYIKGVVAAEMPAEFGMEALKAQAVAARTYAYGKMKKAFVTKDELHPGADVCTDFSHCQAWISKKEATKNWGFFAGIKYWNKISRAVTETNNMIITYKGKVITPFFHSNSGGKTENVEEVWEGDPVPYLKSVISKGEENSKDYKNTIYITKKAFYNGIKKVYPQFKAGITNITKTIKITSKSEGGKIKTVKIGNITLKGTEVRKIFSLKSSNFVITNKDAVTLKIDTIGYGHGVGMSQWGANYQAREGASYEEILKWYYQGVELNTIN